MSDPVYVTDDGKENHCDECLWATRSGGCSQWDCEFIDKTEAFEAWREKHERTVETVPVLRVHGIH